MTPELLKLRRTTALRMADDSIPEPMLWVRDVIKGDVLLLEGVEAEVTGVTAIRQLADIVECKFDLAVETGVEGLYQGMETEPFKANALVRVVRFKGEKK